MTAYGIKITNRFNDGTWLMSDENSKWTADSIEQAKAVDLGEWDMDDCRADIIDLQIGDIVASFDYDPED